MFCIHVIEYKYNKMGVNIRYSCMYNVGTDEKSSRVKNYQMGLNHNWYWVSPKYPNWGLFPKAATIVDVVLGKT